MAHVGTILITSDSDLDGMVHLLVYGTIAFTNRREVNKTKCTFSLLFWNDRLTVPVFSAEMYSWIVYHFPIFHSIKQLKRRASKLRPMHGFRILSLLTISIIRNLVNNDGVPMMAIPEYQRWHCFKQKMLH